MILTASPTAPSPKMATEEPFFGLATLRVAPNPSNGEWNLSSIRSYKMKYLTDWWGKKFLPVEMPQLRIHTLSRGANGLSLARQPEWTTVYSLKVDVPKKWLIGFPLIENLDFPSLSITPLSVFILSRSHILLSSDLQCLHSPHSPVNTGRTWSPTWRSETPSPTLSTILLRIEAVRNRLRAQGKLFLQEKWELPILNSTLRTK